MKRGRRVGKVHRLTIKIGSQRTKKGGRGDERITKRGGNVG
jgi:hypothetical protein